MTAATSLTITKTGTIEFEQPIDITEINLNSITLYKNIYNITEVTKYVKSGKTTVIQPGYYTYEQLQKLMPGDFKFSENTLKVEVKGTLTGGLKKLIDDGYLYLSPLCLYMYVDEIDTSKNYLDGKRSTLLSAIPIGNTDVGEIFNYQPNNNIFKKVYNSCISSLNIKIRDEQGKDYNGKFVAMLTVK